MQPLVEHRMQLAGFDTRALELEGDGPGLVLLLERILLEATERLLALLLPIPAAVHA